VSGGTATLLLVIC